MINISFKYDSDNNPVGVQCSGHAGFARSGKDIICAAVSALVLNTANSIERFTDDAFSGEANKKKGYFLLILNDAPSEASLLLMRSLELGLKSIYEDNSRYISLIDWEVKSCSR